MNTEIAEHTAPADSILAEQRASILRDLELLDRCVKIVHGLPMEIIRKAQITCSDLVFYHCEREDVKTILSTLSAGRWEKQVNTTFHDKINYTATIDGITIQLFAASPPESCRIIEEEVEVPATKAIKRTLVCA